MIRPSISSSRLQIILLVASFCCKAVGADGAEPGELPAGSISISETSGVDAEICRDHLFDPASIHLKLPEGYRLRPAEELARSDSALSELIKQNPTKRQYALGSLCLMSIKTFVVDGNPVHTSGAMPAAFWWAAVDGPIHTNMRGKASWVQIGSWYSDAGNDTHHILRTDPMAQFTKITVERVSPNAWHLSLVLPSETVEADIRATSPSVTRDSNGPGYMSVPMSGNSAEYFSVYSYAGHRIRDAEGNWRATGSGTFTAAFAISHEALAFETLFEEGWTARSGLYRFSPPR